MSQPESTPPIIDASSRPVDNVTSASTPEGSVETNLPTQESEVVLSGLRGFVRDQRLKRLQATVETITARNNFRDFLVQDLTGTRDPEATRPVASTHRDQLHEFRVVDARRKASLMHEREIGKKAVTGNAGHYSRKLTREAKEQATKAIHADFKAGIINAREAKIKLHDVSLLQVHVSPHHKAEHKSEKAVVKAIKMAQQPLWSRVDVVRLSRAQRKLEELGGEPADIAIDEGTHDNEHWWQELNSFARDNGRENLVGLTWKNGDKTSEIVGERESGNYLIIDKNDDGKVVKVRSLDEEKLEQYFYSHEAAYLSSRFSYEDEEDGNTI